MESSKKTWNDQEKKRTVIKFGGGGGGIGAVFLLGGALATAALASAFVVGVKGRRSSTKDRPRRHQNPPPENSTQSEEDEANKGQEVISTDHQPSHIFEHSCEGAIKEADLENDGTTAFLVSTRSSSLDEEDEIEINGETPGDVEVSDSTLCSNSPKKLEKDAVCNDGFVIVNEDFPLSEEQSPLDSQNKIPVDEETEVELTREEVCNDCSKENTNPEQVYIEEEEGAEREKNNGDGEIEEMSCKEGVEEEKGVGRVQIGQKEGEERESTELNMEKEEVEGLCNGDGEVSEEKKCVEAIDHSTKVDLSEDSSNQEAFNNVDSEVHGEEEEEEREEKALLPEFVSVVTEHKNVDGDEKETAFPSETVEMEQEDEAVEESQEEEAICIVEKLVAEEENCDQLSDLIEEKEVNVLIPYENNEEKIVQMIEEPVHEDTEVTKEDAANEDAAEVSETKISTQFDAKQNDEKETEQVPISHEVIEITKDNVNEEVHEKKIEKDGFVNDETDESTEESENISDEEEEEDGVITTESSAEEEEEENKEGADKIKVFNDKIVEETSDSSTVSNSEAVWPAELLKAKLVDYEVVGKIQEDKTVEEDEDKNGEDHLTSSERTSTKMEMVKKYPANSSRRRMVIGMVSLLSSLSCSWFFGLSFVQLCLVLFLTVVVSEIHGY